MSGGFLCSRRGAISVLLRAVALLPGFGPTLAPRFTFGLEAAGSGLGTQDIVTLHLQHLARCGPGCAARAARIRPVLLAAAGHCRRASDREAVESAFALLEHFGEFPSVHGPSGGLQ